MRRPAFTAVKLVVLALLSISTIATAQGGMRGARRGSDRPDEGITGPLPIPSGVAALVLEHGSELSLADSQRVALESIRRTQDSANRPWLAKLDSLRPTHQPAGGQNDLSQEQRDEINARRTAIAQVLDGMKETNAVARQKTMALLTPQQQQKAAELENDAKKKAEEEGTRRARSMSGGGGQDGRTGGGRGRPPTG